MKNKNAGPSWIEKKLKNKKFLSKFQDEYERLSIGEQLLELRAKAGLTQAEVAKRVGTTASAISRYENAEYDRYEIRTLRKIAEACGGKLHISFDVGTEDEWEELAVGT